MPLTATAGNRLHSADCHGQQTLPLSVPDRKQRTWVIRETIAAVLWAFGLLMPVSAARADDSAERPNEILIMVVSEEVISSFDKDLIRVGRRLTDAKYHIRPSPKFIDNMKLANRRSGDQHQEAFRTGYLKQV